MIGKYRKFNFELVADTLSLRCFPALWDNPWDLHAIDRGNTCDTEGSSKRINGNTVSFIYYLQSQKQEIYISPAFR